MGFIFSVGICGAIIPNDSRVFSLPRSLHGLFPTKWSSFIEKKRRTRPSKGRKKNVTRKGISFGDEYVTVTVCSLVLSILSIYAHLIPLRKDNKIESHQTIFSHIINLQINEYFVYLFSIFTRFHLAQLLPFW